MGRMPQRPMRVTLLLLLINACEKSSSCPCISRTTYLTMNTFCWLSTNYSALNGGKYSGNSRVLTKAQAMQSKVPRNSVRNAGSLCASPLSQARCSVALLATYIISSAFSFSAYCGVIQWCRESDLHLRGVQSAPGPWLG